MFLQRSICRFSFLKLSVDNLTLHALLLLIIIKRSKNWYLFFPTLICPAFVKVLFVKCFGDPRRRGGYNLVTVWESWGLGLIWKVLILPIKTRGWWLLYSPYDLWIVYLAMEGLYMICRSHWDVSIIKVVQLPLSIKSEVLMFLSKSSEVTVSHPARAHLYGTFCNLDFRNKRKL